jgi:hypothetical protein
MAKYTVHSSNLAFTGDIVGVTFTDGAGTVDTDAEGGLAAYSYFQRAGYSLVSVEESAPAEPAIQVPEGGGEFDPAQYPVSAVLAYLATAAPDEAARVLAAEAAGQNRKGIVGQTPTDPTDPAEASSADQNGDPA